MHVFGKLEAESVKQLNMLWQTRQPLFASDDVSCTHEVIVHRMSEVVCRDTVGLQEDEIFIVLGNVDSTLDEIGKLHLLFGITECEYTEYKRVFRLDVFFNLFDGKFAACKHFGTLCGGLCLPVSIFKFLFFVYLCKLVKLFLGGKAGVCFALTHQLLCVGLIYLGALTLLVRTVIAVIGNRSVFIKYCALVEVDAVCRESFDKSLCRALNLALRVRIFYAQIEYATALMSKSLAHS